jgi:hypothetical protein
MSIKLEMNARCPEAEQFPDIELYMDQVISVLEKHLAPFSLEEKPITSTMINNYVKQKLIPPPTNKRYSQIQLTKIFMICVLKSHLQLSEIGALLKHIEEERGNSGLYAFFRQEFDAALDLVFRGMIPEHQNHKSTTDQAMVSALIAFCTILYSHKIYREAQKEWPVIPTEEEIKEQEKKEKKEKKEKEKRQKDEKKKKEAETEKKK